MYMVYLAWLTVTLHLGLQGSSATTVAMTGEKDERGCGGAQSMFA